MAASDVEEQQHLLESAPRRRTLGRWLGAGLGAAAVAAVLLHGLGSPAARVKSAATRDTFTALVQLNKGFGKIRKLAEASTVLPRSPKVDPVKTELKDLTCDLDQLDMDICGSEEADLETKCQKSCVGGYRQLIAACPTDHLYAKAAKNRLTACEGQLVAAGEKKKEAIKAKEFSHQLAAEEDEANQFKCMPLMVNMAKACHMDGEPDLTSLCEEPCQTAVAALNKICKGDLLGADIPLDLMMGMCEGCGRAIMQIGGPGAPGEKECKLTSGSFETGKFDACKKGCHPYMCSLLQNCAADKKPVIPGLTKKDMNQMLEHISANTKKCAC